MEGNLVAGDLHTHTTFSDGSTPADKMPFLAKAAGLDTLAISDHDSLRSVRYAYAHPILLGVRLIPAVELSAFDFSRGRRVHLLCYWPDDCAALRDFSELMAARRRNALLQSCHELEKIYPQFRAQEVLELSAESGTIFKAHIMRILWQYGLADGMYRETYRSLFGTAPGEGRVLHKPAYESVDTVLDVAHACRGVVVLAHPSVYHTMELCAELAQTHRIDGVEIFHPRNTPQDQKMLLSLAKQCDLIVTGGTDYHGLNANTPHPVGTCVTDEDNLERLAQIAETRKQKGEISMKYTRRNQGTCSIMTEVELNPDHTIESVLVYGGCNGNLKGIGRLLKGMKAEDAIARMEGTTCGSKPTSCPDQIAHALQEALTKL
jgi:uncharacterized protein (TIGR03905 family)